LKTRALLTGSLLWAFGTVTTLVQAQSASLVDVRMGLVLPKQASGHSAPPAVLWLKPLGDTPQAPFLPQQHYTLLQKNRMFSPHLLVIPVGSVVQFPNADPFFHNVFSLFDGKRFDLGLYEAGSTKAVSFSREGVSYIFCNIHPSMSAVVLTISTRLYTIADSRGLFRLADVPAGDYELHVWIEGAAQPALARLVRHIHLNPGSGDLGLLALADIMQGSTSHANMFGQSYDKDAKPPY
jgi:hypothetical protein